LLLAALLVALTGMAAACGDDGSSGDSDGSGSGTADGPDAPGTHPGAAENEEDAHRIVESLVHDASERTSELYEDPSELDDPDSNRLDRLVALYTPDNPFPESIEGHLRQLADDGVAYVPGPGGFHERIRVFDLTTIDDDTVRFQYCAALSVEITGADMDDPYLAELRTGVGEARLIDATWQIHDMVTPSEPRAWDPERLAPDECDHMALEQLEMLIDVTNPELFSAPGDASDADEAGAGADGAADAGSGTDDASSAGSEEEGNP
jgi:hypothetical protein